MVLVQGVRQSVLACGAVRAVAVLPRVYSDVRCLVTSLVNCTHTLSDSLTRSITRSLTHSLSLSQSDLRHRTVRAGQERAGAHAQHGCAETTPPGARGAAAW